MSTNDNTGTLKSYVDSAASTIQSGIASITGNPQDQSQPPTTKQPTPQSDRAQGSWDQTLGSGKETLGNLVGNETLKREGREQNLRGQGLEAQAQLTELGSGVQDRVGGKVGGVVAGVLGDKEMEKLMRERHEDGKAKQRGVEGELERRE